MINDSAGNPIGGKSNQMIKNFTSNEKMDEIISLLSDIADKLDRNYEELHRFTNVTRQATSVMLNYNEKKKRAFHASLSSLEQNTIVSNNCIFAGYKRSDLTDFMKKAAKSNNCSFVYAKGLTSASDVVGALTNYAEGDVVLFDYSEIDRVPEAVPLLIDAIEDAVLYIRVGKGMSSNSITLDLPKFHIHLFAAAELLIPKELECCFDSVYANE